jgi:uncharacterized alkaline shock family protein YloU
MAVNLPGGRLPCGRPVDMLWNHIAYGTADEHSRSCEYCQAALAQIRRLLTATGDVHGERVRPPADLHRRVMAVIRAQRPPAPRVMLPGPSGNRLNISEQAVAFILRAAGDSVDGVRARSCRLTTAAPGVSTDADLELSISLRYGMPAPAAARAVRAAVRAAARAQLGLTLDRVDIDVVDIHLA